MKGLEPSTFCMARTWREATGANWSRQPPPLRGISAHSNDRNRQQPTPDLAEDLTALLGHVQKSVQAELCGAVILSSGPGAMERSGASRSSRCRPAPRSREPSPHTRRGEAFEPPRPERLAGHDLTSAALGAKGGGVAVATGDAPQSKTGGAAGDCHLLLLGFRPSLCLSATATSLVQRLVLLRSTFTSRSRRSSSASAASRSPSNCVPVGACG